MRCVRCGGNLPDAAQFCPTCGLAIDGVALGATTQSTRATPTGPVGDVPYRTPTPAAAPKFGAGWLSSSNLISHGRFAPGALLDGRYRIIGMLGRGGMGEVYRADDLRLGQPVALKFLPEGLRNDSQRLAQFHNEVRAARQVSHPNVCRVYDIGEANGLLYLSMEYVDGEDLASSLRRIGRFPEDKAIEIAKQLCAGVAAAHHYGVIHRDLKPANIMLDGTGRVRVMDFGLAAVGRVEDIQAGTPAYMAPEQLLGREVTARSDIFALGLVMYELFTGRRTFTAETVRELVSQHESRAIISPSTILTNLDDAIERVILRCLEPDPTRRPTSALTVSAALPGGDPLAAALAAGETPSPEMVAAAGEGVGLSSRVAWPVLITVLAGIAAVLAMALRTSALDRIRPTYTDEVLAQKARDAIRQIGYTGVARDAAYGFEWNAAFMEYVQQNDKPAHWAEVLSHRPSPLQFWYRQSNQPMTAFTFHTDLLTPGIVRPDDPPPITSGMIQVDLDHHGFLTFFEAIPPQREAAPVRPAPLDWRPLFALAGLDVARLQTTEPLWHWLAASDTRAAWTGVWPGGSRPLRVEAAALGGRPVAFMLTGPWRTPWRMPEPSSGVTTAYFLLLMTIAVAILVSGVVLAKNNLRAGRGDRRGAARLALCMTVVLLGLWVCSVHVVADPALIAVFLLAVCTSVFYGALLWTVYIALEPSVRRHWPQVLVSWANVLGGRVSDPVVGRDVLFGVGLGVWFTLIFRSLIFWAVDEGLTAFPGDVEMLLGLRRTFGVVLEEAPYAIRNVLLYFFLLFAFRVLLSNQWAAAIAFTMSLAILNALGNDPAWIGAVGGLLYFGTAAFFVLRWGLLSFAVGAFVTSLLFDVPVTLDGSAWYFANTLLLIAIVIALALWGFYTSVSGRMWGTASAPLDARHS